MVAMMVIERNLIYQSANPQSSHTNKIGHTSKSIGRAEGDRDKHCYYIAFEGMSEFNYFTIIRSFKESLGIKQDIVIKTLIREEPNKDTTEIDYFRDSVIEYKYLVKEGKYKKRQLAGSIVENLCKEVRRKYKEQYQSNINNDFLYLFSIFVQKLLIKKLSDYVNNKGDIENVTDAITDSIELINSLEFDDIKQQTELNGFGEKYVELMMKLIKDSLLTMDRPKEDMRKLSFDEKLDIFALVIDRDQWCKDRNVEDYSKYIYRCKYIDKISLHITNPAFEFWLMMHFDYFDKKFDDDDNYTDLIKNRKKFYEGKWTNYAEIELDKYFKKRGTSYNKYDLDHRLFIKDDCKPIKHALDIVGTYPTDNDELLNHIGSSVGELLNRIIENR